MDRLTIDDVRQKAYGTLEDELEDTLFGRNGYIETREDNLKNVKVASYSINQVISIVFLITGVLDCLI